jgi:hypothetical protein
VLAGLWINIWRRSQSRRLPFGCSNFLQVGRRFSSRPRFPKEFHELSGTSRLRQLLLMR